MSDQVICTGRTEDCAGFCKHATPHERMRHGDMHCGQWEKCGVSKTAAKVRCVRVDPLTRPPK